MKRLIWTVFLAVTVSRGAQEPARTAFDVASVKVHRGEVTFSADPAVRGRRVVATAVTVVDLITSSYGVRYDQVTGGPKWTREDHYDMEAASEGDGVLTREQMRQMVQALLADRFQLQVHHETQESPVYLLVVGNNGPKFHPSAPDAAGGSMVTAGEKGLHMEAKRTTMEALARQLSGNAGRPVLDRTGLAGTYAFTLDWFPANRSRPAELDAPSMFDAVREQLGLRLEAGTGPVDRLLIDRVEKPSEN